MMLLSLLEKDKIIKAVFVLLLIYPLNLNKFLMESNYLVRLLMHKSGSKVSSLCIKDISLFLKLFIQEISENILILQITIKKEIKSFYPTKFQLVSLV